MKVAFLAFLIALIAMIVSAETQEEWFDAKCAQEGAHKHELGFCYKFLKTTDSTLRPTKTQTVKVDYHGTTPDGAVFDSSYNRGQPISFGLNQVISCWTNGVPLMNVGSIIELYCPPQLAYGSRGAGGAIKPNAYLQFKVELHAVDGKTGKDEL